MLVFLRSKFMFLVALGTNLFVGIITLGGQTILPGILYQLGYLRGILGDLLNLPFTFSLFPLQCPHAIRPRR